MGSRSWKQTVGHEEGEPLSQPTWGPDRSGSLVDVAPHIPPCWGDGKALSELEG